MKLWKAQKDEDRFNGAFVEVARCRVKLKGRPRKGQNAEGFQRAMAYLSPQEYESLKEISEAYHLSRSKVIRTMIRMFKATPIDGMEE